MKSPLLSIILLGFALFSTSCRYNSYYPVRVNYGLNTVTAVDLEEDGYWLSTGQDEIYVMYTLASVDQFGNFADKSSRAYGPDEFTYKGDYRSGYPPLSINVPPKGRVIFSVQLIEDDDYSSVSSAIDDAKTIVDIAKFASKTFDRKEKLVAARVARNLRMVSRGLNIAGMIITVVDIFDTNDELMAFCAVLDENQLQSLANEGGKIQDNYSKSGSNWGDRFEYKINFSVIAARLPGKPLKERIKSRTPNIVINVAPFVIDQPLNDYWNNSPDRLLVQSKDNDNEYDWSDGLYNKNLSASLGFGLTPAFRMGLRTFGRIYGQGTYRSLPYILNFEGNNYQVDNSYFNNTSGMPADLKVKDLEFDITQLGGSAYFKLISGGFSWDIGGGMNFNKGRTKFKGAEFGNPNASLAYDETQNVLLPSKFPFGFTKIGFGRINRSSGFQFTFGVSAAKPTYEWNDIFKIYNDFGNGNSAIVPATNKEWRLGYSFGFDILF